MLHARAKERDGKRERERERETRLDVQNAMSGMYKSGALISFRGVLYSVPPATLSDN